MITTEGHSVVALEEFNKTNARLIFAGPNPVAVPEAQLGDVFEVDASLTQ